MESSSIISRETINKVSIGTQIAGVPLRSCIWNASGPLCTTLEELHALGASHAGAIETKSCTLLPRDGNSKPRYIDLSFGSINSMGLPNCGYQAYVQYAAQLRKYNYNKPLIVSVSGLSLADNLTILNEMNSSPYDLIELNLSCPNIVGKPQVAYDFEQTQHVLRAVFSLVKKPLGVKLSPYFDFVHFEQMAAILRQFPLAFVVCINSIGNGLCIDAETESAVIKPKGGFGGIGGRYIKPTALANVRKFYELLGAHIPIVGVGGIETGRDIFEFILAGATAVQVGTTLMKEGTSCFERLELELQEVMMKKGYTSLDQFRGKLREASLGDSY